MVKSIANFIGPNINLYINYIKYVILSRYGSPIKCLGFVKKGSNLRQKFTVEDILEPNPQEDSTA